MRAFRHHRLLGTVVDVRVSGPRAEEVDRAIVGEIERLQGELSVYDPSSSLERWKRGEITDPGADVNAVLAAALDWHQRSDGAFNPSTRGLTRMWQAAADAGTPPSGPELAAAAAAIVDAPYRMVDGVARATGDVSEVDLNAFAKGWIVDRAVEAGRGIDVDAEIAVSAGGDVRHVGDDGIRIGIENPLRPYDNEPAIGHVRIRDAGLASSGRARRGVLIGGRWYAHVIDPRTGCTVDDVASVSVVADDAATADVMATIVGVESAERTPALADRWGVAVLVVSTDGRQRTNAAWRSLAG